MAWPKHRTGLAWRGPQPARPAHRRDPACIQRAHGVACFARGAFRVRTVARLVTAHRRLIGGNVLQGEGSLYMASSSLAWSEVQGMDGPHRRPHGAKHAATVNMAHSVARAEAVGGWTVGGKVKTGIIHGPWRTCLTQLRAPAHSEEGGQWRCGAHRCGRWRRSSTTGKVLLRRLREDPQGRVLLCDLQHGKEGW
jgi:hypothetical protein